MLCRLYDKLLPDELGWARKFKDIGDFILFIGKYYKVRNMYFETQGFRICKNL